MAKKINKYDYIKLAIFFNQHFNAQFCKLSYTY